MGHALARRNLATLCTSVQPQWKWWDRLAYCHVTVLFADIEHGALHNTIVAWLRCVCLHAACVSHETREYFHLKVDQLHIIIWKSKDTPFKPEIQVKD